VAEAGDRWLALNLDLGELTVNNFAVDDNRLEIPKLILEFTFLVLSAKVVDAFL